MSHSDDYKLCLDRVEKLTERRQSATTTYLTVVSTIAGAIAFLFKDGQLAGWTQRLAVIVLLIAGIVACTIWRFLIREYNGLLGWWYSQLRTIEASNIGDRNLITREYEEIYVRGEKGILFSFTHYETRLTWLFTIIFGMFGLGVFVALIIELV